MGELVEYPLQGGGSVVVRVSEPVSATSSSGSVTRGLGGSAVLERAQQTFEEATDRVLPAVTALLDRLQSLGEDLDEVHIEFGVDLHIEAGAVITSGSAGANFTVGLTWRKT
jgi:hypothetical protein